MLTKSDNCCKKIFGSICAVSRVDPERERMESELLSHVRGHIDQDNLTRNWHFFSKDSLWWLHILEGGPEVEGQKFWRLQQLISIRELIS